MVAAKPLEMALTVTHWRGIVLALALLTLLVALLLWRVVPDKESHAAVVPLRQQLRELRAIFADAHFQRYAPMGFAFIGGFMAVQGLWASRWMAVLENLDAAAVAARLTWMGITMLAGFLGIGFFATRLVQRGLSLAQLYQWAMVLAAVALGMICLWPQFAGALLWPMLGAASLWPTLPIRWWRRRFRRTGRDGPARHSICWCLPAPLACNGVSAAWSMPCMRLA